MPVYISGDQSGTATDNREEDWMGFKSNGEDPIRNFHSYVQKGLIEKDGNEVVIYMDL